jgi:hypothetical protein
MLCEGRIMLVATSYTPGPGALTTTFSPLSVVDNIIFFGFRRLVPIPLSIVYWPGLRHSHMIHNEQRKKTEWTTQLTQVEGRVSFSIQSTTAPSQELPTTIWAPCRRNQELGLAEF